MCQFKKEFGHTRVPNGYKGYNNLGRWTKRWREGIRKNEPWVRFTADALRFLLHANDTQLIFIFIFFFRRSIRTERLG